jgi:hypothetical protein
MAEFTIEDVIKAAEKNGFEWNRNGEYFDENEDGTIRACVLGQAALNLDINPDLMIFAMVETAGVFMLPVWVYNDQAATSYEDAVDFLRKTLLPYKDITINVDTVGRNIKRKGE